MTSTLATSFEAYVCVGDPSCGKDKGGGAEVHVLARGGSWGMSCALSMSTSTSSAPGDFMKAILRQCSCAFPLAPCCTACMVTMMGPCAVGASRPKCTSVPSREGQSSMEDVCWRSFAMLGVSNVMLRFEQLPTAAKEEGLNTLRDQIELASICTTLIERAEWRSIFCLH